MAPSFDVFLSHNSQDNSAASELAKALCERQVSVWLAAEQLRPGQLWQEQLEEIIQSAKTAAVLVGPSGLGPWEDLQMRGLLDEFVKRKLPVIPVLLPEAPAQSELPFFLRQFTRVDLRGRLYEEGLGRLIWAITGRKLEPRPETGPRGGVLPRALFPPASPEVRAMIRSAYLTLRVDQFSDLLKTGDPQDLYLWGWSVCDPERKEKVAKAQTEESRAASLVVTSFVHSALAAAAGRHDFPDVVGLLDTLALRFRPAPRGRGVFGTVQVRVVNADGQREETIYRNCRHIASAVVILLRILRGEWSRRSIPALDRCELARKAGAAVKYLMDLEGHGPFSQNPDNPIALPDSGTCAIVLDMLAALGAAAALGLDEVGGLDRGRLEEWRAEKTSDGLFLLEQLRFPVEGQGGHFWDYGRDREHFRRLRDGASPATHPERVDLYHTARILYLLRNLLAQSEHRERLAPPIDGLASLCRQNGGTLPGSFPLSESARTHVTNTAFFLNALLTDSGEVVDERFRPLLVDGIPRLAHCFLHSAPEQLGDLLDLRADGVAMLLRLARCWPELETDFGALEIAARRIQQRIAQHKGDDAALRRAVEKEASSIGLGACAPIILDRVHQARKRWQDGTSQRT